MRMKTLLPLRYNVRGKYTLWDIRVLLRRLSRPDIIGKSMDYTALLRKSYNSIRSCRKSQDCSFELSLFVVCSRRFDEKPAERIVWRWSSGPFHRESSTWRWIPLLYVSSSISYSKHPRWIVKLSWADLSVAYRIAQQQEMLQIFGIIERISRNRIVICSTIPQLNYHGTDLPITTRQRLHEEGIHMTELRPSGPET